MSSEAAAAAAAAAAPVQNNNGDDSSDDGFTPVYADPPPKQKKGKRKSSFAAQQFYAVRIGVNVANAVFFRWEDVEPEVTVDADGGGTPVEYAVFQSIDDAWEYIATGSGASSGVARPTKRTKTGHGSGGGGGGTPPRESGHNKKWEESYKELVEFKEKNGHTLVPVNKQEQSKLSRWVSRQRLEYRYMTEGKPTAMNQERFNKLSQIGFAFKAWEAKRMATMTGAPGGDPGSSSSGTAPSVAAQASSKAGATPAVAAAAAAAAAPYMYAPPPTMAAARRAVAPPTAAGANQPLPPLPPGPIPHPVAYPFPPGTVPFPNSFYPMHMGSKAQKFAVTFDINLQQLIAYKEEHGSADVPGSHPVLGKWIQQMRALCKKKAKGEKFDPMTEDQHTRLMDAGFLLQARKGPKGPRAASSRFASGGAKDDGGAADATWDVMYTQLREYKEREGDTNVPTKQTILRGWVMKQKKDYERLRNNEPSHLTARQVQMLNDLDMNWEIKTTLKWSERFEQLKTFKQKHNHCLVPRNYDEENMEGLGKWVAQQRHAYRLLKDGKPTTMTSERVQQFNDLGMVWSILKQSTKPRAERKSWQERFEELIAYKETKNTTSVPQSYPGGLGNWVHQQRTMYQKYKAGKKSMMNAGKEKKLRDIGFMFAVKKGKTRENKSDIDIAIDRAEKAGALVKTSSGYVPAAASGGDSNDPPPLPAAEVDGGGGGTSEYESANEEEAVML